jgi:hypothetical protein
MPTPTFPLARLGGFRSELHACFTRRADALFELGDALLCAPAIPSLPHLSLEPVHQQGWASAYAALARGRLDTEQLRDLLVRCRPAADPLVFAVAVTTWPRCDAECPPERGYYYHPSRHSAGQPTIAGWAFQWTAQLGFGRDSWTAPVTPAACTRWTTPTTPPPYSSARSWSGCLPAGPCRGLCSTAATTRPSLPWTLPRSPWWCWCGCDPTVAATPTHHHAHPAPAAGRAATGPGSPAPTRPPGRSRPPPLAVRTTRTAPSRQGVDWAASQAAAPPRPRHPWATADRARDHPARPGRTRPGQNPSANGAVVVVGRPW